MPIFSTKDGKSCEAIVRLDTRAKKQFVSCGGNEDLAVDVVDTLEKSGYNKIDIDQLGNVSVDGLEQGTVTAIGAVSGYLKKNEKKFYTETKSGGNGKHWVAFFITAALAAIAVVIYNVAF